MKTRLLNYFRFTRAERNGTLALTILAFVFFAIPEIARRVRRKSSTDFKPFLAEIQQFKTAFAAAEADALSSQSQLFAFDPNTASFEDFTRLGLAKKVAKSICNYRDKGGRFRVPTDFQKIWSLGEADYERLLPYIHLGDAVEKQREAQSEAPAAESFAFDPNTATEAELFRLGLPSRTVKSILNYRVKGGQFRQTEDLKKIYTLDEANYARIAPLAKFESASPRPMTYSGAFAGPRSKALPEQPIDINRAALEDWMRLPGIGETRARQLLGFRDKLGGFLSVDQLREMQGLPDSVFQKIRPLLLVSPNGFRKIKLNSASVAELDAHPYISKRQAELIVAYREQHGAFSSVDDLGRMRAISDRAWLAKLQPYLGLE